MVHRGIRRISIALVVLLVGCAGARRGKHIEWDSILAANRAQFAALWKKVHAAQGEPVLDFSKYVVLAVVGLGGICPQEVVGVERQPHDVLRVRHSKVRVQSPSVPYVSCPDVGVRRALVLAVPRTLLGSSVTFVEEEAFEFSIPKPGQPPLELPEQVPCKLGSKFLHASSAVCSSWIRECRAPACIGVVRSRSRSQERFRRRFQPRESAIAIVTDTAPRGACLR